MSALKDRLELREVQTNKFVGIEIRKDNNGVTIHQSNYMKKMLESFNMQNCAPDKNPITDTRALLNKDSKDQPTNAPYRELIGALLYCASATRPDILYVVDFLPKFNAEPLEKHWTAVKRVLRYQTNSNLSTDAYSGANWAGDPDTSKSISGVLIILSGGAVSYCFLGNCITVP